MKKSIKITKLDAAVRQLRTAIRLWFSDGDPVAIHTLLAAAHEIIHRLFRLKGLDDLLFDSKRIKPEFRALWAKKPKEPANFFKHAKIEGDKEIIIEFNPDTNYMLAFITCAGLHRMGEKLGLEEQAFTRWMLVQHPDLFLKEAFDNIPPDAIHYLSTVKKKEFFEIFEALDRAGGNVVNALALLRPNS
jgi:hypothetical protein